MAAINLNGIFPPITTPFVNQEVAYDKLAQNVEKLSVTGLRGMVVFGSNGEFVYLSNQEKRDIVETVAQSIPDDQYIIAGTGCESTWETVQLTCGKSASR